MKVALMETSLLARCTAISRAALSKESEIDSLARTSQMLSPDCPSLVTYTGYDSDYPPPHRLRYRRPVLMRLPLRSLRPQPSIMPKSIISNIWRRIQVAIVGWGEPGSHIPDNVSSDNSDGAVRPSMATPLSHFPVLRGIRPSMATPLSHFPVFRGIRPSMAKKKGANRCP